MYICRKMRLCEHLLKRGFQYTETRPFEGRPGCVVWVFPQSPELWVAINEYYSNVRKIQREQKEAI